MDTIEICAIPAEISTTDETTLVVVGGTADSAVVMVSAAAPALVVTGDAGVVVVAPGGGSSAPAIDLSNAQDGDVLAVEGGAVVPTHQQTNQIYDGGNF